MTDLSAKSIMIAAIKGLLSGLAMVGLVCLLVMMTYRFVENPHWVDFFALPFAMIGAWMSLFHHRLVLQALRTIKLF